MSTKKPTTKKPTAKKAAPKPAVSPGLRIENKFGPAKKAAK